MLISALTTDLVACTPIHPPTAAADATFLNTTPSSLIFIVMLVSSVCLYCFNTGPTLLPSSQEARCLNSMKLILLHRCLKANGWEFAEWARAIVFYLPKRMISKGENTLEAGHRVVQKRHPKRWGIAIEASSLPCSPSVAVSPRSAAVVYITFESSPANAILSMQKFLLHSINS